jgi:hypothetical protein
MHRVFISVLRFPYKRITNIQKVWQCIMKSNSNENVSLDQYNYFSFTLTKNWREKVEWKPLQIWFSAYFNILRTPFNCVSRLATGSYTLTKRGLQSVWYRASFFKIPVSSLCLMAVQYVLKSFSSSFLFSIFYSKTFQKVNQILNHSKLLHFYYLLLIMNSTPIPLALTTYVIAVGCWANN